MKEPRLILTPTKCPKCGEVIYISPMDTVCFYCRKVDKEGDR
jgi:uncharacterized OB-fold protein